MFFLTRLTIFLYCRFVSIDQGLMDVFQNVHDDRVTLGRDLGNGINSINPSWRRRWYFSAILVGFLNFGNFFLELTV